MLQDEFPEIIKEFDVEKNTKINIFLNNLKKHQNIKVYWKCKNGHSYLSVLRNRIYLNRGCPVCSNQKILKGYNDLQTLCPEICKEWDYEKNNKLNIFPEKIAKQSHKKVWWRCSNNHSYQAVIANRTNVNQSGCPYCSNQKVLKDFNDLQTLSPEIAKEWDYEKNTITPDQILNKSKNEYFWKCSKGHSWKAPVIRRTTNNAGCPVCSNQKVLKGYNDLLSNFPDLCKPGNSSGWWDYDKNTIKPDEVTTSSAKRIYWKCNKGHSWTTKIAHKVRGTSCPICLNMKLLTGYNDLQTRAPELVKEWDYELNNKINIFPDKITFASSKKVHWKCNKGHKWVTTCSHRFNDKTGCPKCCLNQTSKHEQILFNELNHIYQCENRKKHKINGKFYETDIFIPELNLGIEFNGIYWHRNRIEKDKIKEKQLSTKIKMIYVMEGTKNKIIDNKIYFDCQHKYEDNFIWAKNQLKILITKINRSLICYKMNFQK